MKIFITFGLVISSIIIHRLNASEILFTMQRSENPTQFIEESICPAGAFNLQEARHFLSQLKTEVKANYGIDLDVNAAIDEALDNMLQTKQFSETEISKASEFFSQLIEMDRTEERVSHFFKSKSKKKHKKRAQELVLPDKMAAGYVSMLGGALLCVLPFGFTQTLGTGLIIGGMSLIVAGSSEGEKPYYIDTETGAISPIVPKVDPSFGVGKQF